MKLELSGTRDARIAASADDVAKLFSSNEELYPVMAGMLHETSTPDRWVLSDLSLGPAHLNPAVEVAVSDLRLVGVPVEGHTPTALRLDVDLVDLAGETMMTVQWEIDLEVPGPQALARTLRPLAQAGVGRGAEKVVGRFRDWFA